MTTPCLRRVFLAVLVLPVLLLSACTTSFEQNVQIIGPNLTKEQWNAQRDVLLDKSTFTTRGEVEIDLLPQAHYGNTNTNTQGSAKYVYQAKPNSYTFAVTHFMAGVLFKVKKGDGVPGVELINSDGNKYNFPSEAEFSKAVQIPISRLPYWIMGITLGDERDIRSDASGRLEQFNSNGWIVRYYEYEKFGDFILPKRLIVTNAKVGTIKIVVNKWDL